MKEGTAEEPVTKKKGGLSNLEERFIRTQILREEEKVHERKDADTSLH